MACLASHPGFCRHDLETELRSPRARLAHGDYALVPLSHPHRAQSDRPLSHYINDDTALDARCALQHRSILGGVEDAAVIDRVGPFGCSQYAPRCGSLCNDADYLEMPDPGWRFSYTYPLQCVEAGGVRWSPEQIHAYNRDVLRHNNQIARRRNVGVPGEYMMLHPMMDPVGRFPPGFDRPLRLQDFFSMDEPLIDSQRHHYGLPAPETLERLLLLNNAERQLRRQLKQIQLLELYGARRLAEQLAIQLLAAQNALPGLNAPRSLGYGLGPDFDETLSPLARDYGGMAPLEAIGYGNGLMNWNYDVLPQLRAGSGGRSLGPWSGSGSAIPWARSGMYPGRSLNRGYASPGGWPGLPYNGGSWSGLAGGYDPRRMGMSRGPSNHHPFMSAISCDGGRGDRSRSFD